MTNAVGEADRPLLPYANRCLAAAWISLVVPDVMSIVGISETITQPERNRGITDPENVRPQPAPRCRLNKMRNELRGIIKSEAEEMVLISLA